MSNKNYGMADFLTLKIRLSEINSNLTNGDVDDLLLRAGILKFVGDNNEYIQLGSTELANMYSYIALTTEFHHEFGYDVDIRDKLFRLGYVTVNGTLTDDGFRFAVKHIINNGFDFEVLHETIERYRTYLLEMKNDKEHRPTDLIASFDIEKMPATEILELLNNTYIMNDGNGIVDETYLIRKGFNRQ